MEQFKKFFKKLKWENVLTAVCSIVLGIIFLVAPNGAADFICTLIGVLLLVVGIAFVIKYVTEPLFVKSLIVSIVTILLGMFFILKPGVVQTLYGLIFGLFLVLDGLSKIGEGIDGVKYKVSASWLLFVIAALSIGLGIVIMFGEFSAMILLGVSLIADGVFDIFTTSYFSYRIKKVKKELENDDKNLGEIE